MKTVIKNKDSDLIEKYIALPYTKTITKTDMGTYFVKVVEIPDCIAEGNTPEDAFDLLDVSLKCYFADAIENGKTIPNPLEVEKYSGKFIVRLKPSTHYQLAKSALKNDISLNQVVTEAIDSYLLQTV